MFESIEKPAMRTAPDSPFDVPMWIEKAKVHPDHHVQVAHALYSVPNLYLRKHVRVRADKMQVKIYFGLRGRIRCVYDSAGLDPA